MRKGVLPAGAAMALVVAKLRDDLPEIARGKERVWEW